MFYNNLRSSDGAIEHIGGDRAGEGDDESIEIDFTALSPEIDSIVFSLSIYDADALGQSFGQVVNASIRVVDKADGRELARFDLGEDASTETAMVFGELYGREQEWKFRAIGQGYRSGLEGIARDYGFDVVSVLDH